MNELMYSEEEVAELNRAIMILSDHCEVTPCKSCPFNRLQGWFSKHGEERDEVSESDCVYICALQDIPMKWRLI